MLGPLGEADSRIQYDAFATHTGGSRSLQRLLQLGDDLSDRIAVVRVQIRAHFGHAPPRVHKYYASAGRRHNFAHAGVKAEPRNVVDDIRARVHRRSRDLALGGIDRYQGGRKFRA